MSIKIVNLRALSENPDLILVITGLSLVVLFFGFLLYNILVKIQKIERSIGNIAAKNSAALDKLEELLATQSIITKALRLLTGENKNVSISLDHISKELQGLSGVMRSDNQINKAIELARGNSSAEEISLATGISKDEAATILKFHGSVEPS
jgi:hypothetical protein